MDSLKKSASPNGTPCKPFVAFCCCPSSLHDPLDLTEIPSNDPFTETAESRLRYRDSTLTRVLEEVSRETKPARVDDGIAVPEQAEGYFKKGQALILRMGFDGFFFNPDRLLETMRRSDRVIGRQGFVARVRMSRWVVLQGLQVARTSQVEYNRDHERDLIWRFFFLGLRTCNLTERQHLARAETEPGKRGAGGIRSSRFWTHTRGGG